MCCVPLQMPVMRGMLQTRGSTQAHGPDQAAPLPTWLCLSARCPEVSLLISSTVDCFCVCLQFHLFWSELGVLSLINWVSSEIDQRNVSTRVDAFVSAARQKSWVYIFYLWMRRHKNINPLCNLKHISVAVTRLAKWGSHDTAPAHSFHGKAAVDGWKGWFVEPRRELNHNENNV